MTMTGMRGPSKLADVLKRSGLAASVGDAKRIASDISTTERKVQTYFDEKKSQMQDDLANKKFNQNPKASNLSERPMHSENPISSSPESLLNNEVQSAVKSMEIEKETPSMQKKQVTMNDLEEVQSEVRQYLEKNNMVSIFDNNSRSEDCPVCKNKQDHNPVLSQDLSAVEKEEEEHVSLSDMFKEEDKGQEFIYSKLEEQNQIPNTDQVQLNSFVGSETKNETVETIMKPSETNNVTIETKMEVIEEEPIRQPQESKIEVAEETSASETNFQKSKIEVIEEEPLEPKYKENAISQEVPSEPVPQERQMDVSEEQKVDLTQMFNFSSRSGSPAPKMEEKKVEAPQEQPVQNQTKKGELGISTNDSNNHPKTGNSDSIDINEMFNFAKRGKL